MQEDSFDGGETIQDLSRPEHLLVWALRAIAIGQGDCPLIAQTFAKACGPMGGRALQAYFILVKLIGMTGRRRLQVHVPGCPCVSPDERAIIGVVAAAQDSVLGSSGEKPLEMRLRFLIGCEPHRSFLFAAREVAEVLEASGHNLPLRLNTEGCGPAEISAPQLHVVH